MGTKLCDVLNSAVPYRWYPEYGHIWLKNAKNSLKNEELGLCEASLGVSFVLSIVIKRYQLRVLSLRIVSVSYRVTPFATKRAKDRTKKCPSLSKTVFFLPERPQEAF